MSFDKARIFFDGDINLAQILADNTVPITEPVSIEETEQAWDEAEDANLKMSQILVETPCD